MLNENGMLDEGDESDKVPEILSEMVKSQIQPSMRRSAKHYIDVSGGRCGGIALYLK